MNVKHFLAMLAMALVPLQAVFGQNCSHGATTSARSNKLFLYFPTASDATFEATISSQSTAPLAPFDVADLDAGIGTTAQLRNRIFEIVTEDFCEFNVEVLQSTTAPATGGITRWQVVGIGSDSKTLGGGNLFGISSLNTNTGDADPQDFTRVWAASFSDAYGGTGGALNGATNSTLERWATAIGSTTSHEAAHNYGLTHCDAVSQTGEDGPRNHIMNTGSVAGQGCAYTETVNGEHRAGNRRHFSDQSYATLAHNVGLNIQTLYNWDFINPNAEEAHSLEITLLSTATALTISTWWNGDRSPWRDPTVSATGSSRTFQGTSYREFILRFSTDKTWIGGADGIVPGGAEFHIGAGFNETVIVYDTKLKNSGGTNLTLHPRMAGFNSGTADLSSGDFAMAMYNPNPGAGDLIIRDLSIQYLPKLADIGSMLTGERIRDAWGTPIVAFGGCNPTSNFDLKDSKGFHLGKLSDKRFVDIIYDSTGCKPGIFPTSQNNDMEGGSVVYCPHGNALSLFPATSVYLTATIIDPKAKYFDRKLGNYVTGPLASKVFYQFAGVVPDFNKNGTDDLIDIRSGTSIDKNGNGVPDEVDTGLRGGGGEGGDNPKIPHWVWWLLGILILIILGLLYKRKKSVG